MYAQDVQINGINHIPKNNVFYINTVVLEKKKLKYDSHIANLILTKDSNESILLLDGILINKVQMYSQLVDLMVVYLQVVQYHEDLIRILNT